MKPADPNIEIVTRADVLRLARDFRDDGIPISVFRENGLMIGAVAAGLIADNYRCEIRGSGDERTLHVVGNPGSNSRALKSRWERLFEPPSPRPE